uniref:Uncharacterized protein n=1 Tax=Leptobrachium leishanense TaxID=445787 RepID=A0A8C5Q9I3_9ANUR
VAEDHGLCDGDGAVQVTESLKLLVPAVAHHVVLLDCVQGLLFPFQFDDIWFRDDFLCKFPHGFLKCGRKEEHLAVMRHSPLDSDALILVSLRSDHHIGFIEHKHLDLLGIDKPQLGAPVQHGTRRADHNLLRKIMIQIKANNLNDRTARRQQLKYGRTDNFRFGCLTEGV